MRQRSSTNWLRLGRITGTVEAGATRLPVGWVVWVGWGTVPVPKLHCSADVCLWLLQDGQLLIAGSGATSRAVVLFTQLPMSLPLQVDHSDRYVKGDWVRVWVNDGSTTGDGGNGPRDRRRRSLQQSFFGLSMDGGSGSSSSSSEGSEGTKPGKVQLVSESVPDWMRESPVFRAAMEGTLREGEEGEGFTPEQAAAAEAEFWAENYPDRVPAAAAKDTVVAWLYGDGVADSGVRGAVDKDEVYFSARWAGCWLCAVVAVLVCVAVGPAEAALLVLPLGCSCLPANLLWQGACFLKPDRPMHTRHLNVY